MTCWPKDRRTELAQLQQLLNEATLINNGSRCLERIRTVIELSEKLTETDLKNGRQSFMGFLISEAVDNQSGPG